MNELTTHQRMRRMYEHRDADRIPVIDSPWGATIERWRREGLPSEVSVEDYFGLDRFAGIGADNSPRYPVTTVEETHEFITRTTAWGQTLRNWKTHGGVPEFLNCRVSTPEIWAEAKARITPSRDRIDWEHLAKNYPRWRKEGRWIQAGFWFGFDATHSWIMGTETVLVAMATDPAWMSDVFNHLLDVDIALFDMVWEAGYPFDAIHWCDDMGYKLAQFFSLDTYRQLLKPVHQRAIAWAHAKGCKAALHSCGDIRPFVPELVSIGLDSLNPLEVKAGMDPLALKRDYGDRLVLQGGLNAVLYEKPAELWTEMRRIIPRMKRNGGFVASSDHSVPDSVSLEQFREFVRLAKELGQY